MIEYIRLTDEEKSIQDMSALATEIVKEHFDPIIGPQQNDYMIRMFQTPQAIKGQLEKGYQYYYVVQSDKIIGFLAFYKRQNECYLSKFYLRKERRGQGISRDMLAFVTAQAKSIGTDCITLNVNRNNMAVDVYLKLGFEIWRTEVNDIGNGYVMDDYVMRYVIS